MAVTGTWNPSLFCSGTGLAFFSLCRVADCSAFVCSKNVPLEELVLSCQPITSAHLGDQPTLAMDVQWLDQLFLMEKRQTPVYDNINQSFMANTLKS